MVYVYTPYFDFLALAGTYLHCNFKTWYLKIDSVQTVCVCVFVHVCMCVCPLGY